MIIAQISDTHIALDTDDADQRIRDFESTIADLNKLDPAPDVIVHTGDIVHNGRAEEYAQAVATHNKARAPVFVMVGNKDNRGNLLKAFSGCGYLGADTEFIDYAIEEFPIRLIMLDTLNPASNKGDFCAKRVARLKEMIDAETTKPIAVFMHHPPFEVPVGPEPLHYDSREVMDELANTLQSSGRIVAVFSGHVHRFAHGTVGDIPASVVTAISTTLRKGEYASEADDRPLYHLHHFDPKGGFTTETRIVVEPS